LVFGKKDYKKMDMEVYSLPFMNIMFSYEKKKWEMTIENHFISQLEPQEKILLVSKKLEKPIPSHFTSSKSFKPSYINATSLLDALEEGYKSVIEEMVKITGQKPKKSGFGKKFFETETRRLFFGGFFQRPPEPKLSEYNRLFILKNLYEMGIFKNSQRPHIIVSDSFLVPFYYDTQNNLFLETTKDFSRFAKIINSLLKKGKISLE